MTASYPNSIKSFVSRADYVHRIGASDVNSLQDEITAVETELAACPSRLYADVKTRIDAFGVDVKAYGAKGDGATNDDVAIASAVGALADGGRLYFPAGTYVLTASLNITSKSCTVCGDGPQSTILEFTGSSGIGITTSTTARAATIQDMTLQTGTAGTHTAIVLTGPTSASNREKQFTVRNVYIRPKTLGTHYWLYGIKLVDAWHTVIENVHMKGKATDDSSMVYGIWATAQCVAGRIYHSFFYDMDTGIYIGGSSEGWVVSDTDIVGCKSGIVWATTSTLPELHVAGCHTNTAFRGIDLTNNCTDAAVSHSLIYKTANSGSGWVGISAASECTNIRIQGTKIYGAGTGGTDVGIAISGSHCTIVGNVINSQDTGISLYSTAGYNVVLGNSGNGNSASITDNGTNSQVANNAFV